MAKLVLLRHGQSVWNLSNRFTGWRDVDLSPQGIAEAHTAGQKLAATNIQFDVAYTSLLKRAINTLNIVLTEIDQLYLPEIKTWRLNERHYGSLQGLNKTETAQKYGEEQVYQWRRSYATVPPLLSKDDPTAPWRDFRYRNVDPQVLPLGESLAMTLQRVLPFWSDEIIAQLRNNHNVLIVAHGNSLRALMKHIENISDDDIMQLELKTGTPVIYDISLDLVVNQKDLL